MEVIPRTAKTLKILEPIKLPIDKSFSFFNAAIIEAENSGIDVPKDTIETEIILSLIPNERAIPVAPYTNHLDPIYKQALPKIIYNNILPNEIC